MNALSEISGTLENGLILSVTIEDLQFTAYVVLSEPDINLVADFVPKERFEQDGDVHVAAICQDDNAHEQIQDIVFNMHFGDAAVFLCENAQAYTDALHELGQIPE
jgi:hypothetical protein